MPRFRPQRERKSRGNVPSHQGRGSRKPAKRRSRDRPPEPLQRRPAEQRTNYRLYKLPRESMQERHDGRAQKNHGRSEGHEQEVLDHVDGQRFLIERGNGRADSNPNQNKTKKEAAGPPKRDDIRRNRTKMNPAANVRQFHQENG